MRRAAAGLGLTALEAGASLLPLSAALLALALSASAVAARVGLRNAMTGGMALIAIASAIIAVAIDRGRDGPAGDRVVVMGAGLAVPYALAPRLALSALAPAQAGQGSGIVNACTFLGGSAGVAGGATAFMLGGFVAVLVMIALAGLLGAALSRGISEGRLIGAAMATAPRESRTIENRPRSRSPKFPRNEHRDRAVF